MQVGSNSYCSEVIAWLQLSSLQQVSSVCPIPLLQLNCHWDKVEKYWVIIRCSVLSVLPMDMECLYRSIYCVRFCPCSFQSLQSALQKSLWFCRKSQVEQGYTNWLCQLFYQWNKVSILSITSINFVLPLSKFCSQFMGYSSDNSLDEDTQYCKLPRM